MFFRDFLLFITEQSPINRVQSNCLVVLTSWKRENRWRIGKSDIRRCFLWRGRTKEDCSRYRWCLEADFVSYFRGQKGTWTKRSTSGRGTGVGGKIGGNGGRWLVLAKGSSASSVTINQRNAFAELHPRNFCRIHPIEITTLPDCPIFIVFKVPTSPLRSDRPSYKLFILASCHAAISKSSITRTRAMKRREEWIFEFERRDLSDWI